MSQPRIFYHFRFGTTTYVCHIIFNRQMLDQELIIKQCQKWFKQNARRLEVWVSHTYPANPVQDNAAIVAEIRTMTHKKEMTLVELWNYKTWYDDIHYQILHPRVDYDEVATDKVLVYREWFAQNRQNISKWLLEIAPTMNVIEATRHIIATTDSIDEIPDDYYATYQLWYRNLYSYSTTGKSPFHETLHLQPLNTSRRGWVAPSHAGSFRPHEEDKFDPKTTKNQLMRYRTWFTKNWTKIPEWLREMSDTVDHSHIQHKLASLTNDPNLLHEDDYIMYQRYYNDIRKHISSLPSVKLKESTKPHPRWNTDFVSAAKYNTIKLSPFPKVPRGPGHPDQKKVLQTSLVWHNDIDEFFLII